MRLLHSERFWLRISIMPIESARAHFNGEQIVLDEPLDLQPNTRLLVTVLSDKDSGSWYVIPEDGLAVAYGNDEPDYTSADLSQQ